MSEENECIDQLNGYSSDGKGMFSLKVIEGDIYTVAIQRDGRTYTLNFVVPEDKVISTYIKTPTRPIDLPTGKN